MTIIAYEPVVNENVRGNEKSEDLKLDADFVVPESNAFGHNFRDYEKESVRKAVVQEFYRQNHIYQTYEFAKKKKEQYEKLDKAEMTIWECCELLNEYVDESDPDLDEPQIEHLLQSAEAIRRDYPDEDWLHLTALIHDLGKVLLHPSFGEQPQWSVVGDTFPLGCAFDQSVVHHQFFKDNPDSENPALKTKLGIYTENCGLENITMSWGHDEYMYLVAKGNKTTLPPAALFIIRFHSFYAMHRSGAYSFLMNDEDKEMLNWLHVFNKYDLYSKSKIKINQEEVKSYYLSLIKKYFPEKLKW
ncbi:inositol oxygenase 1-like [Pistacia vera]|uniref:inositol oxygenase 1-like n=1 Tax=Pistacia vera TaxID=55513 RepID=UPI0012634FC4|nr:inositol oxygenase 1-like [Pistacia vera]